MPGRGMSDTGLAGAGLADGAALLDLFERGQDAGARTRMEALAEAAGADPRTQALGELDRRIWALRARWLGSAGDPSGGGIGGAAVCDCPACGGRLEFTLPADFAPPPARADTRAVIWQGQSYALRQPRLADIGPNGLDPQRLGDGPWQDPGFAGLAAQVLQEDDPALGLSFAITCPDCGRDLDQAFDPAGYFWVEIEQVARRLLHEITQLARAFGWSERDILALPPRRRAFYLAAVTA